MTFSTRLQKTVFQNWMLRLSLLVGLSLPGFYGQAQCPDGNVTLASQSDVNVFGAKGCVNVPGNLTIQGSDITDLSSLSALTSVTGSLVISYNSELINLTGLSGLTSVSEGLMVSNNPKLTSLDGLLSLSSISGILTLPTAEPLNAALSVLSNNELLTLSGLSSLTGIQGHVGIADNPKLTDLSSLSAVKTISGDLEISNNVELTSLTGLESLTRVYGLRIINSPKLTSLSALSAVTGFSGNLEVGNCNELTNLTGLNGMTEASHIFILSNLKLTNLSGLNAVTDIHGKLQIIGNPELTSITALSGLTAIGQNLDIYSNPKLSFCAIATICQYLANPPGTIDIHDNATGCSNTTEIQAACNNPITITSQPSVSSTVCQGATVTVSVSATGTVGSYQWYKDGSLLSTQTSATLTLGTVQPDQSGSYSVAISNAYSVTVTSNAFLLTVNPAGVAPVLGLTSGTTLPIFQNTPSVSLTISGCSGNANWSGSNATSGTGLSISVPTSATGTLVYSATCTGGSCTGLPGSFTVVVAPSEVSGSFDGFINGADCGSFRGWAWDRNKVNIVMSVDILDGASKVATIPAGDFRQDLLDAGKGNGKHAFRFNIPEPLKDGKPHSLSARIAGSSFILKDSPKALVCQSSTEPVGNKPPVPPTPTILIAPLAAQVGVPFSATLAAFTDPEGSTLTYGLSGLPGGLSLATPSRVISGTPTTAGNFPLAYSATDVNNATNSVSFVLTVNPASTTTVTGSFEGYLDKVECGTIRGWVWDRHQPNAPVTVEFYTGSTVWGSTAANIYRVDLKNAGKGNGNHAYSFEVPAVLKDNTTRLIYGRVQGSTFVLKDSGKPLICPSGTRLSGEKTEDLSVIVLGNPALEEVVFEIRSAGGGAVRMGLFDNQGRLVAERQIAQAEPIERQKFSVRNQPFGLLLLRVQASDQVRTVKVIRAQ
jgi:hypothetical protein